ncbi:MAG: DUF4153 domain-containing protein [Chitinispirillales bacterium]|jgi:hypothetical protein|nr:DUF4153 domain-containing protein [Chitinispirillales bacterium]
MRSLKEYLSISAITAKSLALIKRFPISVIFVLGTEYYWQRCLPDIGNIGYFFSGGSEIDYRFYIFFTLGIYISIAAALLLEDIVVGYVRQYAITAAVMLLWGVYCFSLPGPHEDFPLSQIIEIVTIVLLSFLPLCFISFLKKGTDNAFWNFTVLMSFQYTLASWFGSIIFGGLSGALLVVGALFDINIGTTIYLKLSTICLIVFTHLYFLANIPDKNVKHNNEILRIKPLNALGLYVLAPLVAIYAVILYVYLFKIIIAWELPRGLVTWLVSTLACVGFFTVGVLYSARLEEKNKAAVYMSRYFGLAMLPLLVLMTVGTVRRVSDYGITVFRGYLIVMNIWLYAICIYHFVTKARRIKWIFISFTAVVLLSSVRFCGVPDVTKYILTAQIRGYIGSGKISLNDKAIFEKLGLENREKVVEKIEYLYSTFGVKSVQAFFEGNIDGGNIWDFARTWRKDEPPEPKAEESDEDKENDAPEPVKDYGKYFSSNEHWLNKKRDINGYGTFAYVYYPPRWDDKTVSSSFENNKLTIVCVNSASDKKKTFNITMTEKVRPIALDSSFMPKMYLTGNGYMFLIERFEGRYYKSADSVDLRRLEGYLFYNE